MIAIGSDHGGFDLKQVVLKHLDSKGIAYKDFGCYTADRCDYPDIALPVAQSIISGECEKGILICGTGIGISIAANKVPGIRAAVVGDVFTAKATRQHNDANIIALGGRVVGPGLALELIDAFFASEFEGERHIPRLNKITAIEKMYGGKCNE